VIERVIENWLTNADERQYQIPFCQLLTAEGEKVLYISKHGQAEQGKDIVTLSKDSTPRAYQLKAGRIRLSEWRSFRAEVVELVEYRVNHPSHPRRTRHIPFLVTNSEVSDPVIAAVRADNEQWRARGFRMLRLVTGTDLVARFKQMHGTYLPVELKDFRLFLELVARDGREPLDKQKFALFLESVLPLTSDRRIRMRTLQRSLASALVLSSYVLQSAAKCRNHWALFEGWTFVGSYILAMATKYDAEQRWWSSSFQLCEIGAATAMEELCLECETDTKLLTEGIALTDGHFYAARLTILTGLLSAWALTYRMQNQICPKEDFITDFLQKFITKVRLWGESAVPLFVASALQIERRISQIKAENLIAQVLHSIASTNAKDEGIGVPNPYYEPEKCIRIVDGLEPDLQERFRGHSYSLEALIDFLARRWRRQAIARFWEEVTENQFLTFQPTKKWEWFVWRAREGSLDTRFPARPQSWAVLLDSAENRSTDAIPARLLENPKFALLFVLVFPHRLRPDLLAFIERSIKR